MSRITTDRISQILAFVAVAFGVIALLLACVGLGTIRWTVAGNTNYVTAAANFFSLCTYNGNTGDEISCLSRSGDTHPLCSVAHASPDVVSSASDCNSRTRSAAALGVIGILFLFFGIVTTLLMALGFFSKWFLNFIPGILLFLASLFMLAALAEGSRYLTYNGYSASLYEAGHLFTILSLFLSSVAGGRITYACAGEK